MLNEGTRAGPRPSLRSRVAAWLRGQAGDTMIEVTVAALLVALIAVATFTGYASVAHVASGQNNRAQAAALAEADQARLHGLTLNNLSSSGTGNTYGNTTYTTPVDGTTYKITSATEYVSGNGAASCTTTGTSTADEVQTTSTVSWNSDAYAGGPVVLHGLVTPPQGGALIVRVVDSSQNGISGVTVTVTGPTSVSPLTTDAAGCVEFGGLAGGSYTAYATQNGTTVNGSQTVVATQTKTVVLTPSGGTGGILATFTTTYNGSSHASTADQITAWNPVNPTVYNVYGTASTLASNTYQSSVSSGGVLAPGNYTTYAGSCSGDYSDSGYQVAAVTSGTTQSVSLPVPAMIVDVWGAGAPTEYDDASSAITYSGTFTHATGYTNDYDGTESWSNTAGNSVSLTFTGTNVQWITSLVNNHGYANVYIDNNLVDENVDTYAASTVNQFAAFSYSGLSAGSHTIKIVVDGTKDANSAATYVTTDAFIVGTGSSTQVDDPPSSSVTYGGSHWTHGATGNQNYDSTESFDQTAGDTAQFTFTGTSIDWLAPASTNDGYANVYLDGNLVASNVTAYYSSTVYQQVIWSDAGLANTTHTLEIVVDGTRPSGSSANYVPIDSFVYGTQATGLLTSAPLVTLTDNNTNCSAQENYPATQVPTLTQGALVDPGQPYGNWTVCASSGGVKNTATVANTNYTAGNVVNIYLGTGASGLTSGSCT
jgi:Tfp pilus assembly protein PilE